MSAESLLHVPPTISLLNVVILPKHTPVLPVIAAGELLTVKLNVAAVPHPVEYVIISEPSLNPVNTPPLLTNAIEAALVLQVPPIVESVNVIVLPIHISAVPPIAEGIPNTVIDAVAAVPHPVE